MPPLPAISCSASKFTATSPVPAKKPFPLIEKINRPNVRINYDTANIEFYDNGTKAEDDLPETVPYLVHAHFKDHIGGGASGISLPPAKDRSTSPNCSIFWTRAATPGRSASKSSSAEGPWPPLAEVNRSMKSAYQYLSSLGLS